MFVREGAKATLFEVWCLSEKAQRIHDLQFEVCQRRRECYMICCLVFVREGTNATWFAVWCLLEKVQRLHVVWCLSEKVQRLHDLQFDVWQRKCKSYIICSRMFVREGRAGITRVAETQLNGDGLDRSTTFRKSQTHVCKIHSLTHFST